MNPFEPEIPLTRKMAIGELLEEAAREMPQMEEDGLVLGVKLKDDGLSVIGQVTLKDFSGTVVAEFTREGKKSLTGQIKWTF